ncbi:MAG: VCBS repeat-containing protein [Armatimonadota bacterium]|jgi:hypothetical protein
MKRSIVIFAVVGVLVGVPVLVFMLQARQTGLSYRELWEQIGRRGGVSVREAEPTLTTPTRRGGKIAFLEAAPIGLAPSEEGPRVGYVTIADLDVDGRQDVLVCDMLANRIGWIRQTPSGEFVETTIAHEVMAPARVEPNDVDGDGDLDLLIACMGILFPNNDKIGSVVVLENRGAQQFTRHLIVDQIARVTDVRAADLDGDGDQDLVAGQFGYDDGEIRWLQNEGDWSFTSHILLRLSGTIHTPVSDMDGDGDPDIVALVSQEWEETYVFENDGAGGFEPHLIYGSANEDFGSSGIDLVDLDADGDLDVLYTNGDAFDYIPPRPRPWHGVQWLENTGGLQFVYHRVGDFPGASVARAADVDHDGDLDIIVCSGYNLWEQPTAQSLAWFENNGDLSFTLRDLATAPTHLVAMDVGDVDGDGWADVVAGGMHQYEPYDRVGRVTYWRNRWADVAGQESDEP